MVPENKNSQLAGPFLEAASATQQKLHGPNQVLSYHHWGQTEKNGSAV